MKASALFFSSLIAAAAMSTVPAWATTVNGITWTDSEDGTVRTFTGTATGYVLINGTGSDQGLNGATNVTKVVFDSVGGSGNAAWFVNATMSQDIDLQGTGIVIKGGTSSSGAAVFTGTITGEEGASFTWNNDDAGNKQTFRFEGDLTGLKSSFSRTTATSGNIQFGASTAAAYASSATVEDGVINNISGTGSITTSAGVIYNYATSDSYTTLAVTNSSISAKTLTFGGGANYTVSSTVTGNNSTASNNTLTLSAGTTTFTGAVSNFGTITVASGAQMVVGKTVSATSLSGAGTVDLGTAGAITLSGTSKFSNWTGTIKVGARSDVKGTTSANWDCDTGTVEFSGASGWLNGFDGGTYSANIKLVDTDSGTSAFSWKDGSSTAKTNPIVTLSGKLTGTGTFDRTNTTYNQSFVFSGNLSEFAGTFKHTGSYNYATLTFGGKTTAIAGTAASDGSVTGKSVINWYQGTLSSSQDKRVYFNYSNDVRSDSTITSAILVKQGAGSLTLTGTNTYTGGTTVSAGTLIAGSDSAFGAGALTVNSGASVSANGNAVDLGSGAITINGSYIVTTGGSLATSGAITFGSTGTLDITNLTSGTYTIFGGTGTVSGLSISNVTKVSGRDKVEFADGYKSFTLTTGAAYDLTWSSATGTWDTSTTWTNNTAGGEENPTFADGDTVTFAASDTAAKTISIVGAKEAQAVNVTGGDYAFSAGTDGSLDVRGALTVSSGASLALSDRVLGTVSGGISLESGAKLKLSATSIGGLTNVVSGSGMVVLTGDSSERFISTAGVLTGGIAVEKTGTGKVTINTAQSYTGGTTISQGNLGVGNSEALGTGTITLNGGQITAQADGLNFDNAVVIGENGGTINTQTNNTMTLSGKISGTGTLTKLGAKAIFVTGSSNTFGGTLVVSEGEVMMGPNGNSRGDSNLTDSVHGAKIFVKSGATFTTHMGSGAQQMSTPNTFNGDFYIASGSTLGNKDGHVKLAGNIVFGATDTEGNFSSDATVTYAQHWQKLVEFAGNISGAGTVTLQNATAEDGTAYYKFSGADNTFSGTFKVTGAANRLVKLQLTNQTAAQNAGINLSTQYASLELGAASVNIAGLEGVSGSSVALLSGTSASTLTVVSATDKEFAGTIGNGVSLVKQGTGTLKLSGDNSANASDVTVNAGVLEAANTSALGTGTTTVASGGVLKVSVNGGVKVGDDGSVTFNEGAKFAIDLTEYTVEVDKALSIITASAISFNNQNLGTVTLTSDEIEKYFSATDSNLGDWATGYTRTWGYENNALTLTLVTIPEPSTFGLLAGVGALALVAARRRRRAK